MSTKIVISRGYVVSVTADVMVDLPADIPEDQAETWIQNNLVIVCSPDVRVRGDDVVTDTIEFLVDVQRDADSDSFDEYDDDNQDDT